MTVKKTRIENELGKCCFILEQPTPVVLENQGHEKITGFTLDHNKKETFIEMGGYLLHIQHVFTLNWSSDAQNEIWPMTGGIFICTAPGKYIVGGNGLVITFEPADKKGRVGILKTDEGSFSEGRRIAGRRMNGDQDHQGRHVRISEDEYSIQKFSLYTYY